MFGKTKDSYFWRMGDQGKYCFLYFMNYALLTCCLPLPPHSSATRAPKLWLKVLLPLMPSGYGRDSSPWRMTQSCGENNKRPTQKAAACQKMKSLKCNCARCTLWDETRSLQLRSLIHLCDNLWQQKVGFRSISVSAQRKSRIKTWCQTSTFAWCALTCRRRLK